MRLLRYCTVIALLAATDVGAQTMSAVTQIGGADWWARSASAFAIVLSLLALIFGRLDKRSERKKEKLAQLPIVECNIDESSAPRIWYLFFTFKNRTTNSVAIKSVSIDHPGSLRIFTMTEAQWRDHAGAEAKKKIPPNIFVEVGEEESWEAGLILAPGGTVDLADDIRFSIEVIINEPVPFQETIKLTRPLWPSKSS
jgi:hypothetical protein